MHDSHGTIYHLVIYMVVCSGELQMVAGQGKDRSSDADYAESSKMEQKNLSERRQTECATIYETYIHNQCCGFVQFMQGRYQHFYSVLCLANKWNVVLR